MATGYLPFAGLANSGYDYNKDYNSALAMNAANYGNIYSGFGDLLARQQSANQAIESGYADRRQNAMQLLAGMEQGQREDIEAGATRATSQNTQNLIGRGLGNTTVTSTLARGVESDKNRAVNNLVGQMAGTKANIYSALEGDRLAALGANNAQYNQLARERLAMQERVSSPYPDAAKYAALAQQAGANRMAGAGMGGGGGMGMPRMMPGAGGVRKNGQIGPAPRVGQGVQFVNGIDGGAAGGGFGGPPVVGGPGVGNGMAGRFGGFGGGFGALPPGVSPDGMVSPSPYGCPNGDCGGAWGSEGYGDPTMGAGGMFGSGGYSGIPTGTGIYDNSGTGIPPAYGYGGFGPPPGVSYAYGNENDMLPYSYGGGYAEGW